MSDARVSDAPVSDGPVTDAPGTDGSPEGAVIAAGSAPESVVVDDTIGDVVVPADGLGPVDGAAMTSDFIDDADEDNADDDGADDDGAVGGSAEPTAESGSASGSAETGPAESLDSADSAGDPADPEPAEDAGSRAAGSRRVVLLEREGEVAADFLERLLDICDLDGDIDVDVDGDRAAVAIVDSEEGRVPRRLVGPDGRVLDALQELTRLAVQTATGERSRLMLDIAGFRADRRATLVRLAQETIEQVRTSGQSVELAPMTAFERKVVHDEVTAAGLVSESEGIEPHRRIVISPA